MDEREVHRLAMDCKIFIARAMFAVERGEKDTALDALDDAWRMAKRIQNSRKENDT